MGVIEVATFGDFSDATRRLFEMMREPLGMAVASIVAGNRTNELLRDSRRQAEKLQDQQEELSTRNEKLQVQTDSLRVSEERLQDQAEELRALNEELEERTELLRQQKSAVEQQREEVEKARDDLEQASTYKSEFLANMSHELRTPLNSLLILADSLKQNQSGNLTPRQVDSATVIYEAGNDLHLLINDILDLSKVEAGKLDVSWEDAEIADIASAIERTFTPLAQKKNLVFEVSVDADVPATLHTDRQRLMQILRNLIANAIKFTLQGSVLLRLHRVNAPTGERAGETDVVFSVTDTGIGIAPDAQEHIFDAFAQADGTTTRRFGGTGLGLTISRELARLLNGHLTMHSERGIGSTFSLHLPTSQLGATADTSHREIPISLPHERVAETPKTSTPPANHLCVTAAPAATVPSVTAESRELLIVEDDLRFANAVADLAREHGFEPVLAGDGEKGLEIARQRLPGAIILDVGLPRRDGLSVLDKLKADDSTRDIPVHVISAFDLKKPVLGDKSVGFLHKPVDLEQLEDVLLGFKSAADASMRELLIVEDDDAAAAAIKVALGQKDVQITTASTGAAALRALQESGNGFDCMVMDISLPDFSGFELLERIAKVDGLSMPPVVVHTGCELTRDETNRLLAFDARVVLKGPAARERLLADASLFLHDAGNKLPASPPESDIGRDDGLDAGRRTELHEKHILVVDDDMRNTFAVSGALEDRGAHVSLAANGQAALDILEAATSRPFDLVVMDIMMPVMDGVEATRLIRKMGRYEKLPVIALTALSDAENRQRCIDAGANDFMTKPFDVERLMSLIRVWV